MSTPLYTRDILKLATDPQATARLPVPHASISRRSATCGSRIDVDICIDPTGRVSAYGYTVSACALGQAAATLVARHIVGRLASDVVKERDALADYFAGTRSELGSWPGLEVLAAVRRYPARHSAILLPFDAAIAAAEVATKRSVA